MLRAPALPACLVAVCLVLLVVPAPLEARPGPAVTPPSLEGITLDGVPDEDGWKAAATLPFPKATVPVARPTDPREVAPTVRVGLQDGRLLFGVSMAEDPGGSIGMHLMVAPEGTESAAAATSIDIRPVALRAPRYRALGPRGVGRAHYRIEAAADITQSGRWTLEAGVPIADLTDGKADAKLRMAVVVYTRTQNVITTWPAGATWGGPARWNAVHPPAGGWPLDVTVDAKRLAAEDDADAKRQAAWLAYLKGAATPVLPVRPAAELKAELEANLIRPLASVARIRPDLAVPVHCLLGDVYHRLGFHALAEAQYRDALDLAPGWREAGYGLYVKVRGTWGAMGEPGGASDYKAAGERLVAWRDPEERPSMAHYIEDGYELGMALMAYKAGNDAWARRDLTRFAERYPFDAFIDAHRRMAIRLQRANAEEKRRREADAKKSNPRAILETTKGKVVLELFQDDARNTVFNFVWLAQHGFYDDCTFHRSVPYFAIQTGDPFTRMKSARPELVGTGTPGYAIRTELGSRRALRGYVALANGGPNTDGSQFMIFTGTAVHLRGEVTVFARVVEGLDIVEQLQAGEAPDRIRSVALEGLDPERTYHPSTLSGNRAPKPKVPAVK